MVTLPTWALLLPILCSALFGDLGPRAGQTDRRVDTAPTRDEPGITLEARGVVGPQPRGVQLRIYVDYSPDHYIGVIWIPPGGRPTLLLSGAKRLPDFLPTKRGFELRFTPLPGANLIAAASSNVPMNDARLLAWATRLSPGHAPWPPRSLDSWAYNVIEVDGLP